MSFEVHQYQPGPGEIEAPRRLANRFVGHFDQSGISIVTPNGQPDIPGNKYEARQEIISAAISQAIDPERAEALNSYAPLIFKALVDGDAIQSIMPDSLGQLVYTACQLAQHPELAGDLHLTVGFGANGTETNSLRNAAYVVPPLRVWENLDRVLGDIESRTNLILPRPQLRLFWAINIGVALNNLNAYNVQINAFKQLALVANFLHAVNPRILDHAIYQQDIPWGEHDSNTQLVLAHLSELVAKSTDPEIQSIMALLYRRGANYHRTVNREATTQYAAAHAPLFGDPLPIRANVLTNQKDALFSITFGGRTEGYFDYVRGYLTQMVTVPGFLEYCQQRGISPNGSVVEDVYPKATIMAISKGTGKYSIPYGPVNEQTDLTVESPLVRTTRNPANWLAALKNQILADPNITGSEQKLLLAQAKAHQAEITQMLQLAGGPQFIIDTLNQILK